MTVAGISILALSAAAVFIRHDISHPESIVPWAAERIALHNSLYGDWRQWPHRFMPYGPLLCYPIGLICRLFGLDSFGFHLYLAGRMQSFLYFVGIALLMAKFLRMAGWRWKWAAAFTVSYLALWPSGVLPALSFRADLPAIFWALAAAMIGFGSPRSRLNMIATLACFLISLAYKPALWSFPAAYTLFLLYKDGFRPAVGWCVAVLVAVGIYIAAGQWATDGRFMLNQVGASSMGFTTEAFTSAWGYLTTWQDFPIFTWDTFARLALAIPLAVLLLVRASPSSTLMARGMAIYCLIALVVNTLTLLKVGSGLTYLLESYCLSGVVIGIVAKQIHAGAVPRYIRNAAIGIGVLLFVIPLPFFTYMNAKAAIVTLRDLDKPSAYDELMRLPATAMIGDLAFTHHAESAHSLSDPLPYVQLANKNKISREPLLSRIRNQAFSHIVMSPPTKYLYFAPNRAPWIGAALTEYYEPEIVIPEYEIWTPRAPTTATLSNDSPAPLSE